MVESAADVEVESSRVEGRKARFTCDSGFYLTYYHFLHHHTTRHNTTQHLPFHNSALNSSSPC